MHMRDFPLGNLEQISPIFIDYDEKDRKKRQYESRKI